MWQVWEGAGEGEYNLRLGVMKELHPELIATHQGEVKCEAKCGKCGRERGTGSTECG